jgi:hypothetical protein
MVNSHIAKNNNDKLLVMLFLMLFVTVILKEKNINVQCSTNCQICHKHQILTIKCACDNFDL